MSQVSYGGDDDCLVNPANNKLGFYGATPVVKGALVTTVTTGETVMAAAINSIISRLVDLGLITGP